MNIKKIKKFLMCLSMCAFTTLTPLFVVNSCSSSLESKAKKIINNDNVVSVEINSNFLNQNQQLSIMDLFTINSDMISIIKSNELNNWNSTQKFQIDTEIKYISLPQYKNENNVISSLDVFIEINGLGYQRIIKKQLDVSKINNKIELGVNNYFIPSNNEIRENINWKRIWINVISKLSKLNFNKESTEEEMVEVLNFHFDSSTNVYNYQTNLYCSYDSKLSADGFYINVYTANNKYSIYEQNNIKEKEIVYKIFIPWIELESGGR